MSQLCKALLSRRIVCGQHVFPPYVLSEGCLEIAGVEAAVLGWFHLLLGWGVENKCRILLIRFLSIRDTRNEDYISIDDDIYWDEVWLVDFCALLATDWKTYNDFSGWFELMVSVLALEFVSLELDGPGHHQIRNVTYVTYGVAADEEAKISDICIHM